MAGGEPAPRYRRLEATRPFAEELLELLAESEYVTRAGRPNLAAFARELKGVSYEALRRVFTGERQPSSVMLAECARVLRVAPEYFLEVRLIRARAKLNVEEAGWEAAALCLAEAGLAASTPDSQPPPPRVIDALRRIFAEADAGE